MQYRVSSVCDEAERIWKEKLVSVLGDYTRICLERVRNTAINLSQDSKPAGLD
jgi:hypothetical protein